jgi:carboxymethylenebutenolidase
MTGTAVSIPRPDGSSMRAHLALPTAPGGVRPGVVVLHESFGLNADIRRITDRFAASGYAALAPDLFDRPGSRFLCVAKTMLSLPKRTGPAFDDIERARTFLAARPEVDGQRIAVAGFCLGGGFALIAAQRGSYRVAAPYYGDVAKDAKDLEGICPVVGGYGAKDKLFARHGERLERHLTTLGIEHDVKIYRDAGHSFMSRHDQTLLVRLGAVGPMKVGYVETAAEDSWRRMLSFFERHL